MSHTKKQFLHYLKVSFVFSIFNLITFTSLAVVIGTDERVGRDGAQYPSSAIAKIEFVKNNQKQFCTAPLIAANIALTNAHCLKDIKNLKFLLNNQTIGVHKTWISPKYEEQGSLSDYGFIILNEYIGQSSGWFHLKSFNAQNLIDKTVFDLRGYAKDMPGQQNLFYQQKRLCAFKLKASEGTMAHNCDTGAGSSGAPLFVHSQTNEQAILLGINMKSTSKVNCPEFNSKTCSNFAVSSNEILSGLALMRKSL